MSDANPISIGQPEEKPRPYKDEKGKVRCPYCGKEVGNCDRPKSRMEGCWKKEEIKKGMYGWSRIG